MGNITFELRHTSEGYVDLTKKVMSGNFSGSSSFTVSTDTLKNAVLALCKMKNELTGAYQLQDYDSNDFVLFEFMKWGHMEITGQVGGNHRKQYLMYQFTTDQTFLNEIINSFQKVLSECRTFTHNALQQ